MNLQGTGVGHISGLVMIGMLMSPSAADSRSLGGTCGNWMTTSLADEKTGMRDPAATAAACTAMDNSSDFVTTFIEENSTCLVCPTDQWSAATAQPDSDDGTDPDTDAAATLARLGITLPDDAVPSYKPTYATRCSSANYGYDARPIYITVPAASPNCPGDGSLEHGWKKISPNRDIDGTRNYRYCALCTTPDTYWRSGIGCCVKRN